METVGFAKVPLVNWGLISALSYGRQHRWSRDFVQRWWQLQSVGQRNDHEILNDSPCTSASGWLQFLFVHPAWYDVPNRLNPMCCFLLTAWFR